MLHFHKSHSIRLYDKIYQTWETSLTELYRSTSELYYKTKTLLLLLLFEYYYYFAWSKDIRDLTFWAEKQPESRHFTSNNKSITQIGLFLLTWIYDNLCSLTKVHLIRIWHTVLATIQITSCVISTLYCLRKWLFLSFAIKIKLVLIVPYCNWVCLVGLFFVCLFVCFLKY